MTMYVRSFCARVFWKSQSCERKNESTVNAHPLGHTIIISLMNARTSDRLLPASKYLGETFMVMMPLALQG